MIFQNTKILGNITKVFTERRVFDETDFFLQEGEKVGVVGINGTGRIMFKDVTLSEAAN